MASRVLAFSDPEVIRVASTEFVPVVDNCSLLQRGDDPESRFFRRVAEQGHYAGRTVPSDTRQGQYACTADGLLLASVNAREAAPMLRMMREALERWRSLPPDRPDAEAPGEEAGAQTGPPEGGLVLRLFARDLPREDGPALPDWRARAVNADHAWFTAAEAAALVPHPPARGAGAAVPAALARRLARFHMLDIVRGETPMWRPEEVRRAELSATVREARPDGVELDLSGSFRCEAEGTWAVRPFGPRLEGQRRGYDARLLGRATWDPAARRFTAFEALACGTRWGGSEHNVRWDDLGPAPMAILLELADGTRPGDATPPQGLRGGYWNA